MAELTAKQRRLGLNFAEEIAALAANAPDAQTKKELYAVVHSVRKRYGYSEAEKEHEIMRRIVLGASSVSDLIRETGFAQPDIWRITKKLEDAQLIRLQPMSLSGTGRPTFLFFAINGKS